MMLRVWTFFVVSSGKPAVRSNRTCAPNTLNVPVPVRSALKRPCSCTWRRRSRYPRIACGIREAGCAMQASSDMGGVLDDRGVCTDVVIRAFRAMGLDLQRLVHEDMVRAFSKYPQQWSLKSPDANIDHRRVPNLMRFFERAGKKLSVTKDAADYKPG